MADKKISSLAEIKKIANTQLKMEELTKYVKELPKSTLNTILLMIVEALDENAGYIESFDRDIDTLKGE